MSLPASSAPSNATQRDTAILGCTAKRLFGETPRAALRFPPEPPHATVSLPVTLVPTCRLNNGSAISRI